MFLSLTKDCLNKVQSIKTICIFLFGFYLLPSSIAQSSNQELKVKFLFGLDNHNSFVSNKRARISGLRLGIEFNRINRVGLGMYVLNNNRSDFDRKVILDRGKPSEREATAQLNFGYIACYYERVFKYTDKWECSGVMFFGNGSSNITIIDTTRSNQVVSRETKKGNIFTLEPVLHGEYKFIPWFGVGAGLGYRLLLLNNDNINLNLNSFIYSIKLKIYLGAIYRRVFKKEEK